MFRGILNTSADFKNLRYFFGKSFFLLLDHCAVAFAGEKEIKDDYTSRFLHLITLGFVLKRAICILFFFSLFFFSLIL